MVIPVTKDREHFVEENNGLLSSMFIDFVIYLLNEQKNGCIRQSFEGAHADEIVQGRAMLMVKFKNNSQNSFRKKDKYTAKIDITLLVVMNCKKLKTLRLETRVTVHTLATSFIDSY
jgi:hypothetical protein